MVCPPVRRDNPRALASGLSTVQADEPCSISLVAYRVDLAHYGVSRDKYLSILGLCLKKFCVEVNEHISIIFYHFNKGEQLV